MSNEKRLIDAEAIARKLKRQYCAECNVVRQIQCSACWVNDVLELLDGDSMDAVEVVRCKDCIHWDSQYNYCKRKDITMYEESFCSYGERREGE